MCYFILEYIDNRWEVAIATPHTSEDSAADVARALSRYIPSKFAVARQSEEGALTQLRWYINGVAVLATEGA